MNKFPDLRKRFDQSSNYRSSVDTLKAEQRHDPQPQAIANALSDGGKEGDLRE